jgi:hypothetical protein
MEIVSPTSEFDFNLISLADPQPLIGPAGFYFTQLTVGAENKPLCLQLPECITKGGIVNIKNNKYLDLMFERSMHNELMKWIEQLEYRCQDIIDTKKDMWFQTELTRDDIETMMSQVTRLYQSGKYVLMRVFVESGKNGGKCIAYDENEIGFDLDILEPNQSIISLVMFEGVKFSSRSFEISLKLEQVMVLGKTEKKSSCLIKRQPNVILEPEQAPAVVQVQAPAVVQAPTAVVQAPPQVLTAVQAPAAVVQAPAAVVQAPAAVVQAPAAVVQAPAVAPESKLIKKVNIVVKEDSTKGGSVGQMRSGSISAAATAPTPIVVENLEKNNILEEVTIDYNTVDTGSMILKDPSMVYQEMYQKAREKAKQYRLKAVEAYLEAKQIKTKYMLFDMDDDDSDDSDEDN